MADGASEESPTSKRAKLDHPVQEVLKTVRCWDYAVSIAVQAGVAHAVNYHTLAQRLQARRQRGCLRCMYSTHSQLVGQAT